MCCRVTARPSPSHVNEALEALNAGSVEAAAAGYDAATAVVTSVLNQAIDTAKQIFGVTNPARPAHDGTQSRKWYLPRVPARQWNHHFSLLRLHRAVHTLALKCSAGHLSLGSLVTILSGKPSVITHTFYIL